MTTNLSLNLNSIETLSENVHPKPKVKVKFNNGTVEAKSGKKNEDVSNIHYLVFFCLT